MKTFRNPNFNIYIRYWFKIIKNIYDKYVTLMKKNSVMYRVFQNKTTFFPFFLSTNDPIIYLKFWYLNSNFFSYITSYICFSTPELNQFYICSLFIWLIYHVLSVFKWSIYFNGVNSTLWVLSMQFYCENFILTLESCVVLILPTWVHTVVNLHLIF